MSFEVQKLKKVIENFGLPMGETETGAAWCLKALHPSDPVTSVAGLPDKSAIPSVMMNYQVQTRITPPSGTDANTTWGFDMNMWPHPVCFGSGRQYTTASGSPVTTLITHNNIQLGGVVGTEHNVKFASFYQQAKRWRLVYQSVTVTQDGPDLANQGTVTCCQEPICAQIFYAGTTNVRDPPATGTALRRILAYRTSDLASFDKCIAMPNTVTLKSKEGLYMPLKMTRTCQQWRDCSSLTGLIENAYVSGETVGPVNSTPFTVSDTSVAGNPPFYDMECFRQGSTAGGINGAITSDFLSDITGAICVRNVAPTTSFVFTYRVGIEMEVPPLSALAPQARMSPQYDPVALKTYFKIAREMKDGYPEDYNSLGKLWDIISGIAKKVAPIVGAIPGFGIPAGLAISGGTALGDYIREKTRKKETKSISPGPRNIGNEMSLASKERAQEEAHRVLAQSTNGRRPTYKILKNSK